MIAATLRSAAADLELLKVEQPNGLVTAIFDRVEPLRNQAIEIRFSGLPSMHGASCLEPCKS
mgnify:CR=1 FL=1